MPLHSFCAWLSEAWSLDEASAATRDMIGADAAFFLVVTRALLRLLVIVAAFGVCVLLPMHYVGGTTGHLGGAHLPDAPRPFATQESISKMIGISTSVPSPTSTTTTTRTTTTTTTIATAASRRVRTVSVRPNAAASGTAVGAVAASSSPTLIAPTVQSRAPTGGVHVDFGADASDSDDSLGIGDVSPAGPVRRDLVPRQFSVNSSSSTSLDLTLARAAAPASSVLSNGWSVQLASALDSLSIMQVHDVRNVVRERCLVHFVCLFRS